MINGFNWGQMFHYITLAHNKQSGLPQSLLKQIKDKVPPKMYRHVRFSGTMSNYMNLSESAYGESEYTATMWQQLSNQKHNLLQRLQFLVWMLTGNRKQVVKSLVKWVDKSYLYNLTEAYRQLECETMAFTFNSHMPYMNECDLKESLDSLKYIRDNTNLISVELENETYYADYIVGKSNKAEDARPHIEQFFRYLHDEVLPAVRKVIGDHIPVGISVTDERVGKHKVWNEYARKFAKNNKNIFLAVHVYTGGYEDRHIKDSLDYEMSHLDPSIPVRITEWNAESAAGNLLQQAKVKDFTDRFSLIAKDKYGVEHTYYHTLWTKTGAHFSYIK